MANTGELRESCQEPIDHRRRKPGHRARAAEHHDFPLGRLHREPLDARDELPAVRQIQVIDAGLHAGLSDTIILSLERTAGMDHQPGPARSDLPTQLVGPDVQRIRFDVGTGVLVSELAGQRGCPFPASTRD